jgi:hypothetical protein
VGHERLERFQPCRISADHREGQLDVCGSMLQILFNLVRACPLRDTAENMGDGPGIKVRWVGR